MQPNQEMKDALLRAEGEAMLASIAPPANAEKPTGLVGVDGDPLSKKDQDTSKVTLSPQAAAQQRERDIQARRVRSANAMTKIFEADEEGAKVHDIVYLAHQILFWSRMELSTNSDISDEMIEDLEYMMQWKIYRDAKNFNFKTLVSRLKNTAVGHLKHFERKYSDMGRVIAMKRKTIAKRIGTEGINLPENTKKLFTRPFSPGNMLILRGDFKSNLAAASYITRNAGDAVSPVFVATDETKLRGVQYGDHQFPATWWVNAASEMDKLDETFKPVLDAEALLLVVEDADLLYTTDSSNQISDQDERKAFAIKRIYQWCVDNMVAVILCDNDTEPVRVPRPYGFIPYAQTLLTGSTLTIGADSIKLEE